MKFDDAEYYFLEFQTDLPNEAGGIPIGMYFLWLAQRHLLSTEQQAGFVAQAGPPYRAAELLFELCDGKLMDSDLNARGLAFTQAYYAGYLNDYMRCFGISDDSVDVLCGVADTPENQRKIAEMLDRQFAAWQAKQPATATVPAATGAKPTAKDVLSEMQRWIGPLLEADGFTLRSARYDELIYVREQGQIKQYYRISVTDLNGLVMGHVWFRFGCERLRRIWFSQMDPAYRVSPPIQFTGDYTIYPDFEAEENTFSENRALLGPYLTRFKDQPEKWGRVMAAVYAEQVKTVLDSIQSARDLARVATVSTQMNRQRSHLGRIRGPELLGRIVLLASYTDKLTGPEAKTMRAELLEQFDRTLRTQDEFPLRADVERLLEIVLKPGFAEKAREFLER